jgi:recA bacterial DNA recombination protein
MSSLPLVSNATVGRSVVVAAPAWSTLIFKRLLAMPTLAGVTPASRLEVRPTPKMVSSGVREIDALTGGLPRGCLTEVCGPASSGRTTVLLAALAAATQRQEMCALVDISDAFNPHSAAAAGVNFERLLWVRCGGNKQKAASPQRHPSALLRAGSGTEKTEKNENARRQIEKPVEQALRVTDLLLQSGGFGLVIIDLGDTPLKMARRISLTSWFRFQRAVEHTPTVLFVISQIPCVQTCASLLLKVSGKKLSALGCQLAAKELSGKTSPTHAQLLHGLQVQGELLRSRLERKPAGSVTAAFTTKVRAG